MNRLRGENMLDYQGGPIRSVFFAGLPRACEVINEVHKGFVKTFKGGESIKLYTKWEFLKKEFLNIY